MILYTLIGIVFLLIIVEFIVLLAPIGSKPNSSTGNDLISILVVVKNEQTYIESCIDSLLKQDYPNIEILIADDGSTDETVSKIRILIENETRVDLYQSPVGIPAGRNAKALNLDFLHNLSKGNLIAVADGDCKYPTCWLSTLLANKPKYGVISGITGVEKAPMEHLDWLMALGRIASLNSMGFRTTAVGNNMLYDRKAYNSTGGWKSVSSHLTEDYALNQQILEAGFESKVIYDKEVLAVSEKVGFLRMFNQRKRWKKGADGLAIPIRSLLFLDSMTLPVIIVIFALDSWYGVTTLLIYWLVRMVSDIRLLIHVDSGSLLWLIPYFPYRLLINFSFQIYNLTFRKIEWKGRQFN